MARKGGYGKVDCKIVRDSTLTPESRLIYTILATYCSEDNRECSPTISELLSASGMSKNTFYKYMRELEEKGIVRKHYVRTGPRPLDRKLHYQLWE